MTVFQRWWRVLWSKIRRGGAEATPEPEAKDSTPSVPSAPSSPTPDPQPAPKLRIGMSLSHEYDPPRPRVEAWPLYPKETTAIKITSPDGNRVWTATERGGHNAKANPEVWGKFSVAVSSLPEIVNVVIENTKVKNIVFAGVKAREQRVYEVEV